MVAAILIIPVLLRHYEHKKKGEQQKHIVLPAQVTETVNSAATTTEAITTTSVTTIKKPKIYSITHKTIEMMNSQTVPASTTITDAPEKATTEIPKPVIEKVSELSKTTTTQEITTTSCSSMTTTTTLATTTTAKTTTTSTGVSTGGYDNTPVMREGYYPTDEEWNMFCVVVCSETGYCEDKAQLAVAYTVINRIANPKFPNTIKEILTQKGQYTCIQNYYTGRMRKGLEVGSQAYNHTMQLIHQAWDGQDFIGGAVAYYNPHMIGWNAWFEQFECTYEDQYGRFFRI